MRLATTWGRSFPFPLTLVVQMVHRCVCPQRVVRHSQGGVVNGAHEFEQKLDPVPVHSLVDAVLKPRAEDDVCVSNRADVHQDQVRGWLRRRLAAHSKERAVRSRTVQLEHDLPLCDSVAKPVDCTCARPGNPRALTLTTLVKLNRPGSKSWITLSAVNSVGRFWVMRPMFSDLRKPRLPPTGFSTMLSTLRAAARAREGYAPDLGPPGCNSPEAQEMAAGPEPIGNQLVKGALTPRVRSPAGEERETTSSFVAAAA